jgi:GMP synthase-like glutamine amidotransferase
MILLVDLCNKPESLSRDEFVGPIERIVRQTGRETRISHFTEATLEDADSAAGVILCGTALQDTEYLTRPDTFLWLRDVSCPVLGICAGMQVCAAIFGCTVVAGPEIGMTDIRSVEDDPLLGERRTFQAYELHGYSIGTPGPFRVIAESDCCVQAIRHPSRNLYGVMFHPEVRNEWVVERFLELTDG